MHRKPEPKAAAQLLVQAFAAHGATIGHQAALNLLATLEGYESYAHLKAARQVVAPAPATVEDLTVHLLFSEEYVGQLNEARQEDDDEGIQNALGEATTYQFDTPEQLQAFLEGVDAGAGWLEYENVTAEVRERGTVRFPK
jgi:hypothetical protein